MGYGDQLAGGRRVLVARRPWPPRKVLVALAVVVVGLAAAGLPPASRALLAHPETSAEIVAALNATRVANGLPPVTENKAWDAACHDHDVYMSENHTETHFERPGRPGYTKAGAFAGENADLAPTSWAEGDPWSHAPLHLVQLMSPALRQVGAYQYTDPRGVTWNCITTWPGYAPGKVLHARAQKMYSYPGPGQRGVPTEMVAYEAPEVPNGWVGLPTSDGGLEGGVTGPFIYLYWAGPAAPTTTCYGATVVKVCVDDSLPLVPSPVQAELSGPSGAAVPARLVSQAVERRAGHVGDMPPASGILIPAVPLRPHATYMVKVRFSLDLTGLDRCPWGPGAPQLSRTWCLPRYAPFSATFHFTTA